MRRLACVLSIAASSAAAPALCCTGFVATDGTRVLVGNNEDYYPTDTVIRVRPATAARHACLLVGFSQHGFSMGGVNDHGLFYDSFSVPSVGLWRSSASKEPLPSFRIDDIAERCATVDEAIAFCRRYDLPYFRHDRLFVADASGAAAVIEWGDDDVAVIRKQGAVQVVTNFYLAHPERGGYPCWRYERASAMLGDGSSFSWDLFRSVLSAVQQHWNDGGTRYSNIYDLGARRMSLFNASNFDEFTTFDLAAELGDGEHTHQIPAEYSELRLVAPVDQSSVSGREAELAWTGKPTSTYEVCLGVDSQADRCDRATTLATRPRRAPGNALAWSALCLGLVAAAAGRRRGLGAVVAALSLTTLLVVACGAPAAESDGTFRRRVAGLRPHTTYSWKVLARASVNGITTESVARTFTTGN